jgi:hypothetical protein
LGLVGAAAAAARWRPAVRAQNQTEDRLHHARRSRYFAALRARPLPADAPGPRAGPAMGQACCTQAASEPEDERELGRVRTWRRPRWRSDEPVDEAELRRMREEFWDTEPHYGGDRGARPPARPPLGAAHASSPLSASRALLLRIWQHPLPRRASLAAL